MAIRTWAQLKTLIDSVITNKTPLIRKAEHGALLGDIIDTVESEVEGVTGVEYNIIANKGVGLDANKPASGLTIGDIYVSNDTYKKYTATGATTWDAGIDLVSGQNITDSSQSLIINYIYTGSSLIVLTSLIYDMGYAMSDETSELTTDNDVRFVVTRNMTLQSITLVVETAPVGSAITVDVTQNGTTILTGLITIPAASTIVTITPPQIDTADLSANDIMVANTTAVGSGTAGTNMKIYFNGILR